MTKTIIKLKITKKKFDLKFQYFCNYDGISYWFIFIFYFQSISNATIMLNLVLPLGGIMNIMNIN